MENDSRHLVFSRRQFVWGAGVVGIGLALGSLVGCSSGSTSSDASSNASGELAIDMAAWRYDAENDVYYQIGVPYCTVPVASDYESMGIYVPGAYFDAQQNADGETYACTLNETNEVAGYTALTAPLVMPINTAGYSAQQAPSEYSASGITDYLEAGFVYVFAGCRGRANGDGYAGGAPWGVTDLKAAVRTLRLNAASLPGSTDRIFTFGHSGGGAQSALVGATGDAAEYEPYLESIGAPMDDADGSAISDAVAGSMCWCPITNLDYADGAYEWNMGQFADSGTRASGTFTNALSWDLAAAWAGYLNGLGLEDEDGNVLQLEESEDGVYLAGSYYDYVKGVIEESLNDFLADTEFPYTPSNEMMADMGAGGGGGTPPTGSGEGGPNGNLPGGTGDGESRSAGAMVGSGSAAAAVDNGPSGAPDGGPDGNSDGSINGDGPSVMRGGASGTSDDSDSSTTYETAEEYIAALNGDEEWIAYDSSTNTATIADLGSFVKACKAPTKDVGAFDALDRSQAENDLFGTGDDDALHFDVTMRDLLQENASEYAGLANWDESYPTDYADDMEKADDLGNASQARQDMYNPMYYLSSAYEGYGTSTPAAHWRIRTGIEQGDTANVTEINLALAARMAAGVSDVDFATVWGQGHTTAERTGSSTENFITWVNNCVAG